MKKKMLFPLIITSIFIIIMIYLIINIKQENITCIKETTDNLSINLEETIYVELKQNKISNMKLVKEINLPSNLNKEENISKIKDELSYNYEYLGKDKLHFKINDNIITSIVEVNKNETLILDNISFSNDDNIFNIKINPNTKDENVITLKVGDEYLDGEFMIYMKSFGYKCV